MDKTQIDSKIDNLIKTRNDIRCSGRVRPVYPVCSIYHTEAR